MNPVDGLSDEARAVWQRLAPHAGESLGPANAHLFAMLCDAVATAERLRPALTVPIVKDGKGGVRKSPALAAWREVCKTAAELSAIFGIDRPDTGSTEPEQASSLYARVEPIPPATPKRTPAKRRAPAKPRTKK